MSRYRLWVNEASTMRVELWPATTERPELLLVAFRARRDDVWGPPETLAEERVT